MLSFKHSMRHGTILAIAVTASLAFTVPASALDLREPNLRGTDQALPAADAPAPTTQEAVDMIRNITVTEIDDTVEVGMETPIAASLGGQGDDLRDGDTEVAASEPDMTALTAAIPGEDAQPKRFSTSIDPNYTLSGPRRAAASTRALPGPTTSLTVLGRDITGRRNPRSSTVVILGR